IKNGGITPQPAASDQELIACITHMKKSANSRYKTGLRGLNPFAGHFHTGCSRDAPIYEQ
ncbi:hypothetical protein, partial [Phaeobacter sp. B1627]|uniref:hypothetical protein n=1 Tax=Phaeobacter sp. B1627 TaxID=2583809 RepID=UPI001C3FFCA4